MAKFSYSRLSLMVASSMMLLPVDHSMASEASQIERIEVTGSRILRTDLETALPVTTLTAADIEATGLSDVSSVIAQLPYNSQGSWISAGAGSAQNHSSSGMRGLGSERTLTLLNGRRIAPSATFSASSVNLNFVPIEAVERIDILRDGASAIYGSDAIGGVINIILKKEFEGLLLKANFANPTRGQRDELGFTVTVGSESERTNSLLVLEHKEWEGLAGGGSGRAPLEADWELGYNRSTLYSPYGTYQYVDENGNPLSKQMPGPDCPQDMYYKKHNSEGEATGDIRCGFNFLDGKDYLPKRQKSSIFTTYQYQITDNLMWDTQVLALFDSSKTAPPAIHTGFGDAPFYMEADNPNNPTFGTDNPQRIQFWSRFVGAADRDTHFDSNVLDIASSLTYLTELGSLKFDVMTSRQKVDVKSTYFVFEDKLRDTIADGAWDPFTLGGNASVEDMARFQHTFNRDASTHTRGASLSWASDTEFELAGGTLAYATGVEYQEVEYEDEMDRQSLNGDLFGAFGGNSEGERSYKAAYVELDLPILDDLTIKVASRYDQYSVPDAGQLSSSVNAKYTIQEGLVLRASYGQGFRAPGLNDLLGGEGLSFDGVVDTKRCLAVAEQNRPFAEVCETNDIERRSAGNADLKPEESDQFSAGIVWDITEQHALTIDFYHIEIDQQVQFLSAQDVVDLEAADLLKNFDNEQISLTRDESGQITNISTSFINMAGIKTQGIDLGISSEFYLGEQYGQLNFTFDGSYVLKYETQDTPTSQRYDEVGFVDLPEYRFNTGFSWMLSDFTTSLMYRYTAAFLGQTPEDKAADIPRQDFESWYTLDLSVAYDAKDYGKVVVGARNLTDQIAEVNYDYRYGFNDAFHDVVGRVMYLNYQIQF